MSTAAVMTHEASGGHRARRAGLAVVEDACLDCGSALAVFEEHRCAGCSDLALHAECRDCGRVLRDADLDAGACADCLA